MYGINFRIQTLRMKLNLNKTQFARKILVSTSAISKIENLENRPSDLTINRICWEFDVNKTWLKTGKGTMFNNEEYKYPGIKFRIKELRDTLNLNQEKFANRLDIKKHTISKLESGQIALTKQLAEHICDEFDVNYDWIVSGIGPMFRESMLADYIDDLIYDADRGRDFEKYFFRTMASLNKEQWLVVQEIMDKMIGGYKKN